MKWNEMKWNEMTWNEMNKWNEMKWNEMKRNEKEWNKMCYISITLRYNWNILTHWIDDPVVKTTNFLSRDFDIQIT